MVGRDATDARWLRLLALLPLVVSCDGSADVLATGTIKVESDGGSILFVEDPEEKPSLCVAGHYKGRFDGTIGIEEPNISAISGLIDFDLIRVFESEFNVVRNSKLEGDSIPAQEGAQAVAISADVNGASEDQACREGHFEALLQNGTYGAFQFWGIVEGNYDAELREFEGEWTTFAEGTETEIGRGDWFAQLDGE